MEVPERLKSGWDIWCICNLCCLCGLVLFYSKKKFETSADPFKHTKTILLVLFPVCLWRRLGWLHRPSGWASVVPLCADSSYQSYLPASIPSATIHRQAPGYRVPACAKCATVYGLRQGPSLWVNFKKKKKSLWYSISRKSCFITLSNFNNRKCVTWSFSSLCLFSADTKRKVEQISEELRTLDEMLAGNDGADGAVEVTAEATSPAQSDDLNQADRKGAVFFFYT